MDELGVILRNLLGAGLVVAGVVLLIWGAAAKTPGPIETVKKVETSTETVPKGPASMGKTIPLRTLPDFASDETTNVKMAYEFASEPDNHALLKAITCFCGCNRAGGHENLLGCYIEELRGAEKAVYTQHAVNCKTCLNQALMAKKLFEMGKPNEQIKAEIDAFYGR